MRFGLASQGLLLVGIPLVFQVVLFCALLTVVDKAEVVAQRAVHANQIMVAVHNATSGAAQFMSMLDRAHVNDAGLEQKITPMLNRFMLEINGLRNLLKADERYSSMNRASAPLMAFLDSSSSDIMPLYRQHKFDVIHSKYLSGVFSLPSPKELFSWLRNWEQAAQEDLQEEAEFQGVLSERYKVLLIIGLVLGVGLSLYLARFFSVHITQRLQVIADNSLRLLDDRPLNPAVSGSDEINDLDRDFRDMNKELRMSRDRERAVQLLKEQVVTAVASQLAEPLHTVSDFLGLVDQSSMTPDTQLMLTAASRTVEKMGLLIGDLQDLQYLKRSGTLRLTKTSFPMSAAVAEARELVTGLLAGKGISVTVTGDATAYGDRRRVVQVLTNLLTNAVKFSMPGSSVSVDVTSDDGCVSVQVSDRGRGIPRNMLETIFSPFQQAKATDARQYGGSGMGLAICKAIVDSHGGAITVKSQEGAGSTFRFTLPSKIPSSE